VVERPFSWLGQNRRLSKDYGRLPESGEAFTEKPSSTWR
jgi:transposase